VLKLTPHNLLLHREVNPLPVVLHLLLEVNLLHRVQSRHLAAHLPEKVHLHRLLITRQVLRQQINLLLKVAAVASPKQVKLKQPATVAGVKQDLVLVVL
jgi:hypothetical protein